LGTVGSRPGPMLAATDEFEVHIRGVGGHAAYPHLTRDPIVAAAHAIAALQTVASRAVGPLDSVVATVAQVHAGTASNIIPESAPFIGPLRTLRADVRRGARERLTAVVEGVAAGLGCRAEVIWHEGYPVTSNDPALTETFFRVAADAPGVKQV